MGRLQRIWNVIIGVLLAVSAAILAAYPDHDTALSVVCWTLFAILLAYGVRTLGYYLTMARHMVGGKRLLCIGIIMVDASFLLIPAAQEQYLASLYLTITYIVVAGLNIVQALDIRKFGGSWKWRMAQGVVSLCIAVLCVVDWQNAELIVVFFAIGLAYEAFMRVVMALRRQAIIHIA